MKIKDNLRLFAGEDPSIHNGMRFSMAEAILFFGIIGLIEYFLYFREINHFFQGDSVFWLCNRATSWKDFFSGFVTVDVSHWYRPLGNRLVPFLFYDWFGLAPAGYRIVIAILFAIDTLAVAALLAILTRSKIVMYAGTFFFAIHTVNAMVTFDIAFVPELLYCFFFISAAVFFVLYCRHRRGFLLVASGLSYVFSLWSKESAVVLPFVLVAAGVLTLEKGSGWRGIAASIFALKWHFLIFAAYLAFAVGYLHVAGASFNSLLKTSSSSKDLSYSLLVDRSVLRNADYALNWAFNIPHGWECQFREMRAGHIEFLRAFRLTAGILSLALLFSFRRRWFLLGISWFVIALGPAFLLGEHFLTYYLFLPLFGISLVIGAVVDWLNTCLERFNNKLGWAGICVFLIAAAALLFVCNIGIQNERTKSPLLGWTSSRTKSCLDDLKMLIPNLDPNTTLFIIDDEQTVMKDDLFGGCLFRLLYNDQTLRVLFSSNEDFIPPDSRKSLFFLRYTHGHLQKESTAFLSDPRQFLQYYGKYSERSYPLQLSASEIVAGKGSYSIRIPDLPSAKVRTYYTLNGGPIDGFVAQLDARGEVKYDVSLGVRKGCYRFWAFKVDGSPRLYKADATIVVR
jgi:hypothetical protein